MVRSIFFASALALMGLSVLPLPPAQGQSRQSAEAQLEFGLNAYQDGFFEPAIDAFRDYLEKAGNNAGTARVRYLLAEALRRENRLAEAISAYRELLRRHPRHERADEVRFRVGELAEKSGKKKEAISAYASVRPGRYRTEAVYRVAALRIEVRAWAGAVLALDEFLQSAPKDPRVENALFERAVALDHIPRIRAAEAAYDSAVRRFPRNPRARAFRLRLAEIRLQLKKFAAAEKTLDALFRAHPEEKKRPALQLGRAASLFAQKKYLEAGAAFEEVLRMKISASERTTAEEGVASSWWRAGRYAKAAHAYRRLIRDPVGDGAHLPYFLQSVRKAGNCAKSGEEHLLFALRVLGKGAKIPLSVRFEMAECLFDAGLEKEALAQYRELIRRAPRAREAVWSGLRLAAVLEKSAEAQAGALLDRYGQIRKSFEELQKSGKKVDPEITRAFYQGVLRAASIYHSQKDCAQAVRLVKMVPAKHVPEPLRPETAFLRAECAWEAGALKEAETHFLRVAAGGERDALATRALYRLGEIAERRGNTKEALERFEGALPSLPEEWKREARLKIGELYRARGDVQKARAFLLPLAGDEKVSASTRRSIWYFLARNAVGARDWASAEKAFARWSALAPPNPGEGLGLWAFASFQRGDCTGALRISERALQGATRKNEKLDLHRLRASCFLRMKNWQKFAGALRQVLVLDPNDAEAALKLGEVSENIGDVDAAVETYAQFVRKFPRHAEADAVTLRVGTLELRRNRPEAALAAFRRAAKSKDRNISHTALFQVAVQLEKGGERDKALEIFESLAHSGSGETKWLRPATWQAAAIRESRREWKRAIRHYQRITALGGRGASARLRGEIAQAQARIRQLESYVAAVEERERKMKSRVPLLR